VSAHVDEGDQRAPRLVSIVGWDGHLGTKHRQIVVIAQIVRELVRLIGQLADYTRPHWLDDLQCMPQVFHVLAPFVQASVGPLCTCTSHGLRPAAVDALQAGAEHCPIVIVQRPAPDFSGDLAQ
jgi:hypothetical protein